MEYNFSSISVNALVDVEKKLQKICDNVLDDINNFIHVLNDEKITEKSGELNTVIRDIMRDQLKVTGIQFTETMNKVQRALAQYL
jgi:hypothetical protein